MNAHTNAQSLNKIRISLMSSTLMIQHFMFTSMSMMNKLYVENGNHFTIMQSQMIPSNSARNISQIFFKLLSM